MFNTLSAAKVKELKKMRDDSTIKNLTDAMKTAAIGAIRFKMNSSRSTYIYPDNSRLTIRLDGYCYEHTGWVNLEDKAVFISEEDITEPALNLNLK